MAVKLVRKLAAIESTFASYFHQNNHLRNRYRKAAEKKKTRQGEEGQDLLSQGEKLSRKNLLGQNPKKAASQLFYRGR